MKVLSASSAIGVTTCIAVGLKCWSECRLLKLQHTEAAFVATRKGRIFFVRLPTTIPGDSASLQQKRDERVQARKDIEQKSAEIRKKKVSGASWNIGWEYLSSMGASSRIVEWSIDSLGMLLRITCAMASISRCTVLLSCYQTQLLVLVLK